jgi:hypothetical protein
MKLMLNDVKEEDRGIIAPCGIICAGCDWHTKESHNAAKTVIEIWEGHNLPDVALLLGLNSQEILNTIKTLKEFAAISSCPGCFKKEGGFICSIGRCVKGKGYWTCAECEDYNTESSRPCPHSDTDSISISRGDASAITCKRYNANTIENLKKCREIGYPAFIEEVKEKVVKGWRTWQVISNEMVVTQREKS